MMEITNAQVSRYVGKFNFANPSEVGAQIAVRFTVDGILYGISDIVEPGSTHDYDGDDISDAVDAIQNAIDRYWISTGREELRERIKFFWAHEGIIRKAYASSQATLYQRLAAKNAATAMAYLSEATSEIEPSAAKACAA